MREVEAVEAAGREHDAVEAALDALAQAGVDVAAQALDTQVGPQRAQLRAAAHRGGADARALRHRREVAVRPAPGIARIGARQHGGEREARASRRS